MFLKVMDENDSYTLHECTSVRFYQSQSEKGETVFNPQSICSSLPVRPFAMLDYDGENGKVVPITGQAYVLNSEGKTVDRFSHWITDAVSALGQIRGDMRGVGVVGSQFGAMQQNATRPAVRTD